MRGEGLCRRSPSVLRDGKRRRRRGGGIGREPFQTPRAWGGGNKPGGEPHPGRVEVSTNRTENPDLLAGAIEPQQRKGGSGKEKRARKGKALRYPRKTFVAR